MARSLLSILPRAVQRMPRRSLTGYRRFFQSTADINANDSTPGWEGRQGEEHALHRPALDPQADASHKARAEYQQGKQGSQAISRKDERDSNEKAKEEHPEAPGPVIGMNDERGAKGH